MFTGKDNISVCRNDIVGLYPQWAENIKPKMKRQDLFAFLFGYYSMFPILLNGSDKIFSRDLSVHFYK
jgi:hypothetical protein